MTRTLLTILATALLAVSAAAQDVPTPVPSSTPEDVVKISTSLVQFDVSVTGKDGRPITDLKPGEIRVFENGKERKVSGLSFVAGEPAGSTAALPSSSKNSAVPLLPGKKLTPSEVRRAIAIVVDDLTLSFESTDFVRQTLRQFVDRQMQPGDLVAIVRSGGAMGALQQFTSDKRQLYAAIDRIHWNALGNGRIATFNAVEPKFPLGESQPAAFSGEENSIDDINKANAEYRENMFATGSLGALNYVIRGMRDLPGRKSVLMLSEGFRLFTRDPGGNLSSTRVVDAVRMITDSANRASVVLYTLDPRGLQVPMFEARDNTQYWTEADRDKEVETRAADLRDTQEGLQFLAEETGGFAIINNNDLSKGIRKILDDQSYYLVAYEPDDAAFDPAKLRFNKIEIKISRPGTNVRYRRGFFNVGDKQLAASRGSKDDRIRDAVTSPFASSEIPVHFNAIYNYDAKSGPFIRSLLHMNIADLDFKKKADGKMTASFNIYAYAYAENGIIAAKQEKAYTIALTPENYEKMRTSGFVYDFLFPIQKPGAYQLRIAVRDNGYDKIGSASQFIEVPDLKKDRLTLSGVVLDSGGANSAANPLTSTAIREFKPGSRVDFGTVVFNAKTTSGGKVDLTSKLRVFRDGKLIFEGTPQAISQGDQSGSSVAFMGSVSLGTKLAPGDYVMEIAVTDSLARSKYSTALQYVQFSVTG